MKIKLFAVVLIAAFAALAAPTIPTYAEEAAVRRLGALTPEAVLEYMKTEKNLVIVDVAAKRYFDREHFEGAVNIPIEELDREEEDELYAALPKGRPVVLHCRLGMIVPGAYERLTELRPDIPEIAYIDGAPLFREYNEWLANGAGERK